MYVELKFYRSNDMFKVASEEYLSGFHSLPFHSLPCNSKCWKKDVEFFSKIRVTFCQISKEKS